MELNLVEGNKSIIIPLGQNIHVLMGTSHNGEDSSSSLLQLVVDNHSNKVDENVGWDDVLRWFEHSHTKAESQVSTRETNSSGETALHIILKNNGGSQQQHQQQQLIDVVNKFVQINRDVFKIQDSRGCLPLHNACHERACSCEVIEAVIEAYPPGLSVKCHKGRNSLTHSPFGWDYNVSVGGHFTDFIQYICQSDACASGANKATRRLRKSRYRVLGHCKNWVPLDILKKGMLNERNLEAKAMIRWLNEIPCKRTLVCTMVFELYLHMAWIVTFVYTTMLHIEDDQQLQGWEPIALLVFATLFFVQELYQMYRFVVTNAGIAYWLDLWNWIDLTTSGLVAASAIKFLQHDESVRNDQLLMCTGFFQFVLLISYLKKTFFYFAAFVSGVIKIFWVLVPFLVISAITLFAFSYMYYVQGNDNEAYYDPIPHQSPNPYTGLISSFQAVYSPFASGPEGNENVLDFLFGISIVIVLLNVVIAIVTEAWEDAMSDANKSFWNYRLDLILEKTRGCDENKLFQTALFGGFRGLDDFYINSETVGTTIDELKSKLAVTHRENGVFFCLIIVAKSLGYILLGFPTLGVLWPKFFRQILFTPPKPKEDDIKVQMDQMATEIAECKELARERDAGYKELRSDIACYRKEVEILSERVNTQIELMQQLLTRDSEPAGRWFG